VSPGQGAILFVEVPFFYAAVERGADPGLRERPIVVGGDPRKRGRVQSASPEAVAAGVEVGMSMIEALDRCPRARPLRTDMKRYREVSGRLRAVLRARVERLEAMGLEGAFIDVGAAGSAFALGCELRERVRGELGLSTRVGISAVKFLARVAAQQVSVDALVDASPEAGVIEVPAGEEAAFLAPLPLDVLPGVGPRTLQALAGLGARRVGDVPHLNRDALERELGNHGLRILELACGDDSQPVRAARAPRTLSQEHTFETEQLDLAVIAERLQQLAVGLEGALRRQGLGARRVAIKVRYGDHGAATRTSTLGQPIRSAGEILEVVQELLGRTHAGARTIRGLGIHLAALDASREDERQLDLFGA